MVSIIKYSSFPKLIKLSDSIKSCPHSFCVHHGSIGNYWVETKTYPTTPKKTHGRDVIIRIRAKWLIFNVLL